MSWVIEINSTFSQLVGNGKSCWVSGNIHDSVEVTAEKSEAKEFTTWVEAKLLVNHINTFGNIATIKPVLRTVK